MSTRAHAENGYEKETMGFIIQGSGYKSLLLRGMGPSIPMPDTLPNPFLQLNGTNGGLRQLNDNWKDSQQSQIAAIGMGPPNDLESAMISSIEPNPFTAVIQDNSGATGIANIELYDLDPAPTPFPPPPTPTPPPPRNVWHDPYGAGSYVGYNSSNDPYNNKVYLRTTGQLSPQAPGTITVNFTGYAHGTCLYGCPYVATAPTAQLYPELLNANGTKVAEGAHMGFPGSRGDIQYTMNSSFSNWSGAPFLIRMVASSNAYYPTPDYVALTRYDVYAP
jgi:hypothetical protein